MQPKWCQYCTCNMDQKISALAVYLCKFIENKFKSVIDNQFLTLVFWFSNIQSLFDPFMMFTIDLSLGAEYIIQEFTYSKVHPGEREVLDRGIKAGKLKRTSSTIFCIQCSASWSPLTSVTISSHSVQASTALSALWRSPCSSFPSFHSSRAYCKRFTVHILRICSREMSQTPACMNPPWYHSIVLWAPCGGPTPPSCG